MSNLREGPRKPAQTFWTSETTRRILKRVVDARNEEVESVPSSTRMPLSCYMGTTVASQGSNPCRLSPL